MTEHLAEMTRSRAEPRRGGPVLALLAQDRVEDVGLPKVRRDPNPGNGDEADPGILEPGDLLRQDLPELLPHPVGPGAVSHPGRGGSSDDRTARPPAVVRRTAGPRASPCGGGSHGS